MGRSAGMTLLEVLVAVAILAGLIASIAQIRIRAMKQTAETVEKNAACVAARNLMACWESLGSAFPPQGNCPQLPRLTYQLTLTDGPTVGTAKCRTWKLAIFRGAPLQDRLLFEVSGLAPVPQEVEP